MKYSCSGNLTNENNGSLVQNDDEQKVLEMQPPLEIPLMKRLRIEFFTSCWY
jgi:hypothetical protein